MEIGVAFSIFYLVKYPYVYVVLNLIIASCLSGTFTTITPLFSKVFGKEIGPEMYGLTGFFIGVASFCGPVLTKQLIKETKDYKILYFCGGGICIFKFIMLLLFKENSPFVFKVQEPENEYVDIEPNQLTRPSEGSIKSDQ